jgi:transposase
MTIISELGDLRRFESPRSLVHFLGLAPGEHSTGASRRQGAITKCGNGHARWMLVDCAQHYRKPPKVSAILSKRQEGQKRDVKELSWRVQHRLNARYRRLKARGKREQKVIVAIARELATFVWELQNKCALPIPVNSVA